MSRLGKDILEGMKNAADYLDGKKEGARRHVVHVPTKVNVGAIRKRLKLTQKSFADQYGFALSAVKEWEQGRRNPERTARILLKIIEHDPTIVNQALG
ncbi:MAG: helix-turn-helix domain-containing protein [Deltaproteobacteria bacterium]|nr:helix-turn-helix domain-containing protein [Deltaproteobacteria bacterium]